MADTALLFFAGALAVVVLSKIVAKIWAGPWPTGAATRLVLLVIAALVVGIPLGWIAWAPLGQLYLFDYWPFIYWIVLGRAIALLVGCLAGFVLVAAFAAVHRWGTGADIKSIAILSAGLSIAILALYFLAVPGARQSLGLTGIKAGGFEISLAAPALNPTPVNSFSPLPAQGGESLGDYTGWYNNLWPMVVTPLSVNPPPQKFLTRGYFEREEAYLNYVTNINWDHGDPAPKKRLEQATKAMKQQGDFIRSLRPVIGCIGFYHTHFPDVAAARSVAAPFIENLIVFEKQREYRSLHSTRREEKTFENDQAVLTQLASAVITRIQSALLPFSDDPSWPQRFDATFNNPNWGDCTLSLQFKLPTPPTPDDDDLEPPYKARRLLSQSAVSASNRHGKI